MAKGSEPPLREMSWAERKNLRIADCFLMMHDTAGQRLRVRGLGLGNYFSIR